MPDRRVRRATAADDEALGALHRRVFPHYPSSALGESFATALLRSYRLRSDVLVLVAEHIDDPDGYLVAAPREAQRAVNLGLRGRAVRAALTRAWRPATRSQLVTPAVRARVRGAGPLRRRPPAVATPGSGTGKEGPTPGGSAVPYRVILIGVDPGARGQGVADGLLVTFAEEARRRGHRSAELVVASDNVVAHRCYERNGWRAVEDEPAGTGSSRYGLDLAAGQRSF